MKTHGDWYKQVYEKTMGVRPPDPPAPPKVDDSALVSANQETLYWKNMYKHSQSGK